MLEDDVGVYFPLRAKSGPFSSIIITFNLLMPQALNDFGMQVLKLFFKTDSIRASLFYSTSSATSSIIRPCVFSHVLLLSWARKS